MSGKEELFESCEHDEMSIFFFFVFAYIDMTVLLYIYFFENILDTAS